jgi:hypothetical protein
MHQPEPTVPALAMQLENAITRNATLIVLLRHAMYEVHSRAPGHSRAIEWTKCNHEDCRKVREILAEKLPPRRLEA